MKKKPVIIALLQSALALTLLVGTPILADASTADNRNPDLNPPYDDRITDNEANTKWNAEQKAIPDRVTNVTERDRVVMDNVRRNLEPYHGITVEAEEGIVRLRGNVDTMQERDAIIQRARSAGGVMEVQSFIHAKDMPTDLPDQGQTRR